MVLQRPYGFVQNWRMDATCVYGHADEYLSEAEMSPAQRVNCRADKLATAALIAAVEANEFISSIFPWEKV
jgi:hypothetical protein